MEKLQILIGDALEAEDVLVISFLWKDLTKCMSEFFCSTCLSLRLQNLAIIAFFLKRNILFTAFVFLLIYCFFVMLD